MTRFCYAQCWGAGAHFLVGRRQKAKLDLPFRLSILTLVNSKLELRLKETYNNAAQHYT